MEAVTIRMKRLYIYEELQMLNMWDLKNFQGNGWERGMEDGLEISTFTGWVANKHSLR